MSSLDLPVWSNVETMATLYQRDDQRFHLLLTEPKVCDPFLSPAEMAEAAPNQRSRLVWLEISPSRVTMTMQGNGKFSYRHLWERGVYGISRYWLQGEAIGQSYQLQLRNYALNLEIEGDPLPTRLHLDYELWSADMRLGRYMLHLDIQH